MHGTTDQRQHECNLEDPTQCVYVGTVTYVAADVRAAHARFGPERWATHSPYATRLRRRHLAVVR